MISVSPQIAVVSIVSMYSSPQAKSYANEVARWANDDPARAPHATEIMAQGGSDATELHFIDLSGTPPPLPTNLHLIVLTFHSSNTSEIHDTSSQLIDMIVCDILKQTLAADRQISMLFDLSGLHNLNQVENLFDNLSNRIPAEHRDSLSLQTAAIQSNDDDDDDDQSAPVFARATTSDTRSALDASEASYVAEQQSRRAAEHRSAGVPLSDPAQKIILGQEKPKPEVVTTVNAKINEQLNLELGLKTGVKVGDKTFSLDEDGGDFIGGDDFDPTKDTEWCLLKTEKNYQFITEASAQSLTEPGKLHPLTRKPFTSDDIIRGKKILTLMSSVATPGEPASAVAA